MKIIPLQSGSNGNCVYVETSDARLLFDAGISGVRARQRLAEHDRDIRQVDAVLISHDHSDHVRCAGVFHRKFRLPVHFTKKTFAASQGKLGAVAEVCHFDGGEPLHFGQTTIETIPTPHDGVDGVAFVVDDGKHRLGILTDLGHVFEGLAHVIASLDGILLESNYDAEMLTRGPYPGWLKQRIRGRGGHLSNTEAAKLLDSAAGQRMRWVCLAHLSEENNDPRRAMATHRHILGDRFPLHVASRHGATGVFEL